MFMKPGGVMIQMLPYGFTLNEQTHRKIRGDFFEVGFSHAVHMSHCGMHCWQ